MFDTCSSITVASLSVRECGPAGSPTICFLHADWYTHLNMRYGNALPEQYFKEVREDTGRMTASKWGAEEHSWNLQRPELFNKVTRAWLTDQPLPPALLPFA